MHLITMLALLSILVLVHELGHFLVAKALGFKISRFGFGLPFGPTLFEKKYGDLTICIHALLLGGYVSFPDDDPELDLPKDSSDRFANKPIWKRMAVVIAGVTANVFLAYLLVLFVALVSGTIPSGNYDVIIKDIQKGKQYSAEATGIKAEDKILSANGTKIESPYQFTNILQKSKKFDGYVDQNKVNNYKNELISANPKLKDFQANKALPAEMTLTLPPESPEALINFPKDRVSATYAYKPTGYKLNETEIKLRDNISAKNQIKTDGKATLQNIAAARSDNAHIVNITVLRNGKEVQLFPALPNENGFLGIKISSEEIKIPTKNVSQAVTQSGSYLYRNTDFMIRGLGMLFTGKIQLSEMHGIVAITKIGSDIIEKKGIWDGLLLTALISMDLAIVNLLPIPALDGGHVIFLIIEKLRGKPLNEAIQETISKISFIFLLTLMVLIIFNDVIALFMNKF